MRVAVPASSLFLYLPSQMSSTHFPKYRASQGESEYLVASGTRHFSPASSTKGAECDMLFRLVGVRLTRSWFTPPHY